MAVQTTEEFKDGGAPSYTTTIEYLQASDLKVRIEGALQTYTTGTPGSGEYSVSGTTVTLGAQAPGSQGSGDKKVHIYRETDVNTAAAVFAAGSSIRAVDLNAIHDMARFAAVEHRNKIINANVANDAITSDKIADDQIDSEHYVAGSIDLEHMSANSVDSDQYVDGSIDLIHMSANSVDSDQYVDGSIDLVHMSPNSVDSDQYVDGSIDLVHMSPNSVDSDQYVDGSIDRIHLEADIIDSTKLADNAVNSEHIHAGSIDHVHLATDIIDGDNIEDNAINSEHYADGSIDHEHLSNDCVDEDNIQDDAVRSEHIQANAVSDSEIVTGTLDNRYYTETELDNGQLNNLYYTETELNNGQLDNRYYTETELDAGQLDNRYFTEQESDNRYFRQDSSETISSGNTWTGSDAYVATTGAIDLRIIELVDNVGGFVPIANETSFPTENPDINTSGAAKGGTIVSVETASTNLTAQSGTTLTIANGRGTGNAVIITGVSATIPSGYGFLVETTATDHTYAFHRLVPKATEVATVAANAVNIAAAGANVASIDNFADRYQISTSAPTARPDTSSLQIGDLWFDSSSNKVMMVYDASAGDGFTAITPNASTLTNINIVAGHVTYTEDLGNITDALNTGSGNNSINTVGSNISNVNTAATNIAKITTVADDLNETTSEIDTVATNITNVNNVGNNISNVNAVHNNATNINAAVANASNINSAVSNASNINAAVSNATNITTVAGNNANVTTVAGSIANVNTAATNIASINTAASNISNVNNFTDRYQIDSSNPAQDGGGNALAPGDLYFNTTSNELRIYNGSSWQGGVTATGNLAGLGANTFTGNQSHGDNVKNTFGTGNDLEVFHTGSQSTIQSSNVNNFTIRQKDSNGFLFIHGDQLNLRSQTDNDLYFSAVNGGAAKIYYDNSLKLETTNTGATITGLMTATTIDGAAGDNLQLDFGTL